MKYIIGIILIIIFVSAVCYLWYMWEVGSFRNELSTDYPVTLSTDADTDTHNKDKSDGEGTHHHDKSVSELLNDGDNNGNVNTFNQETEETNTQTNNGNPSDEHALMHTQNEEDDIKESPFGFGLYPDIPTGFPVTASWEFPSDMFPTEIQRQGELVTRVLIKLYNEGDQNFIAGKWHNGKVYPIYPNTFYVEVNEGYIDIGGKKLKTDAVRVLGPSGTHNIQKQLQKLIPAGKTVPGVRVLEMQSHGINPYNYVFSK